MKMFLYKLIIFISSFYFMILNKTKEIPAYLGLNLKEDIQKLLFIITEDKTISFNNSLIKMTFYNTQINILVT